MTIDDIESRIGMVRSPEIAERFGSQARLGRGFFFLLEGALTGSIRSWIDYLVPEDQRDEPRVVPLFGEGGIELPGFYLSQITPPDLHLASVTSDRRLYRAEDDAIELFVFHPFSEDEAPTLEVTLDGSDFRTRTVELDEVGCGEVTLHDLPVGEYEVQFADAPDEAPPCSFTVAQYQLAGLVARVLGRRFDGEAITVELEAESYGQPVDDAVRVELNSDGRRIESTEVEAEEGELEVDFELEGDGPFPLQLQLVDDPDRTATVPLTGTRKEEREATSFGTLGVEVRASLLPGDDAREVRGLYLNEGATRNSLFQLEDVAASTARLSALADIEAATAVLFEASGERRDIDLGPLERDETVEIRLESPAAILALGAVSDDRAWEGWTTLVAPAEWSPDIDVEGAEPGETGEVSVSIEESAAEDDPPTDVYLVVKDARLASGDTPQQRLAGSLKSWGDEMSEVMETDYVDVDFDELGQALRTDIGHREPYAPSGGEDGGALAEGAVMSAEASPTASVQQSVESAPPRRERVRARKRGDEAPIEHASKPSSGEESTPEETSASNQKRADVLFAGLLRAEEGEASVEVEWPDAFADIDIEAFATDGTSWAQTEEHVQVERTPFLALELPTFVHGDDTALATLTARCESGRMVVEVEREGESVELWRGDDTTDGTIEARRARLSFPARAGDYRAVVRDLETDETFEVERTVRPPGVLRSFARSLRVLEPGERLETDGDVLGLRPLPGVDETFERLCEATADYEHLCCEQTAAKIRASCAIYLSADGSERRRRAADAIEAGVEREQKMWLEGEGFKLYPTSSNTPNDYYGEKAARHLRWIELLEGRELSESLQRSVELARKMARDADDAYGLAFPPESPETCEAGYAAVRFGDGDWNEETIDLARDRAETSGDEASNSLRRRTEEAYAAAILLRAGEPSDTKAAIELVDRVASQIGSEDRLYSTTDSVAAIAMMDELRTFGLAEGEAELEIDGERLTLDEALERDVSPDAVECIEGRAAVEVERIVEEDWNELDDRVDLQVELEADDGSPVQRLEPGDPVELAVELVEGYQAGDLLRVCLPDALTRLRGGGQVDEFTVDFEGGRSVRVPLVATAPTIDAEGWPAPQHFAVCVRNMFEEERTGHPGPIEVRVEPDEAPSFQRSE